MEIIPVLDLKAGRVVHASGGLRDTYQPVCSLLCPDGEPLSLVQTLSDKYTFHRLYIADLDAITAVGNHDEEIRSIQHHFPSLELWIDAGIRTNDSLEQFYQQHPGRPVIGSETLGDSDILTGQKNRGTKPVLSLDFNRDGLIGFTKLENKPNLWPDEVIVMSLDHVGSSLGPDFSRLRQVKNLAGSRRVYAAGGIRNNRDISQLAGAGIDGVLAATALHNGQIKPVKLRPVNTK